MSSHPPDPVANLARTIADYLRQYPLAADNVTGIRQWWLASARHTYTEAEVQAALDLLAFSGRVVAIRTVDGTVVYRGPRGSLDSNPDSNED